MSAELKAWRHLGGGENALMVKSDGERSVTALRESSAKFQDGRITPEAPAKEESQSNGAVEEAGKTIREHAMVMKEQVEDNTKIALHPEDIMSNGRLDGSIGRGGRNAFPRRRGLKCSIPVVPMGSGSMVQRNSIRQRSQKQTFNRMEARDSG